MFEDKKNLVLGRKVLIQKMEKSENFLLEKIIVKILAWKKIFGNFAKYNFWKFVWNNYLAVKIAKYIFLKN